MGYVLCEIIPSLIEWERQCGIAQSVFGRLKHKHHLSSCGQSLTFSVFSFSPSANTL